MNKSFDASLNEASEVDQYVDKDEFFVDYVRKIS